MKQRDEINICPDEVMKSYFLFPRHKARLMAMQITSSNKETAEEYRALVRHERHEPEAKANQQKTEMDKQSQLGCLNTCCYKSCSTRELSFSSMFFVHLAIKKKKKEKTLIFNLTAPQVSALPIAPTQSPPPGFCCQEGKNERKRAIHYRPTGDCSSRQWLQNKA